MDTNTSTLSMKETRAIAAKFVDIQDFEVLHVKESSSNKERCGFMSDYLRFEIRVRRSDGTEQTCRLFAKTVPRSSGQHRQFVLEVQSYVKESSFYHNIMPLLMKHLKESPKSNEEDVKGIWTPYCFHTRDDFIVMEDLSIVGFKIFSNRELMDWDHCVAVIKKMASFHAASVIFEEKEKMLTGKTCRIIDIHPEIFSNTLKTSMSGNETKGWFQAGVRALVALVPYLSKCRHNKHLQKTIQEKFLGVFQTVSVLSASDTYKNVVCHGDLWSSNIMFRYGTDKRPETARFVDFQLLRYAPPATDLVIFIFTTTNRIFRKRHNDALLRIYHDEFSSELQSNGLCADGFLNFDDLRKSFEFFSPAGRAIAGLYYQLTTMDTEQRNTLFSSPERYSTLFLDDRSSLVRENFEKDEIYRNRLEEALDEIIEKDILNQT